MRRTARLIRVLCTVLVVSALPLRAAETDEATETFNALYGADLARVRGTGDVRDDVELAVRLLAAAKRAAQQPAFLTVLCEKAYDLALRHPAGYGTALEAMDLLSRTVPEKTAACAARTFEIRQIQFDAAQGDEKKAAGELLLGSLLPVIEAKEKAGALAEAAALYRKAKAIAAATDSPRTDQIDARAEALAQQMKTAARIADVKALLARDPANVSAREGLVRLYLVDLDDPAEAAKHLKGAKDPSLLKYVPAAAKGVEAPPELACLELGEWYARLAAKAPPHAKEAMYARARAYLERFLTMHTSKDLSRTRATLALEKVEEAIAKLSALPAKPTKPRMPTKKAPPGTILPGQWVDLLALVDPVKDVVKGTWRRQGAALVNSSHISCLALPVVPRGSYELQISFVRTSGGDSFGPFLPVGSGEAVLVLSGWFGQASGLGNVNGKHALANDTGVRPAKFENNREYFLAVKVQIGSHRADVAVTLDGKPYIQWRGPQSALSVPGDWLEAPLIRSRRIGLSVMQATLVFRSVRLKMLSGEAKRLRPAGK